jgi:hypothetical protein
MAAERKRNARRHARKNIRLMRQQNNWRVVSDFRQRPGQIVDPISWMAPPPHRDKGDLIAQSDNPERFPVLDQTHGVILIDGKTSILHGLADVRQAVAPAHRRLIRPPVMIAKHGMNAERRVKPRQCARPGARRLLSLKFMSRHIVANEQGAVGALTVGQIDNFRHALRGHPRIAGVKIGYDREPQP